MTIDPRFYELAKHLWRDGKFAYYWSPSVDGEKLTFWHSLSEGVPEVPKILLDIDCFFGVHPTSIRRGEHERAKPRLGDITVINGLYAEIDYDTEAERLTALGRIAALPWRPACVVHSGGGYHLYWLLRHPWLLPTSEEQAHAIALQYAMVEFVSGDDGAKDLARVLRVPGSHNHKQEYAPHFPTVEIIEFDLSRQYDLGDFLLYLMPLVEERAARKAHAIPVQGGCMAVGLDDQELLDVLFRSRNGQMYQQLWHGDMSPANDDHSKADLKLCGGLAWVTGRDTARMDTLFRLSGLYREKWERRDYREDTLRMAAESAQTVYSPSYRSNGTNGMDTGMTAFLDSAIELGKEGSQPTTTPTSKGKNKEKGTKVNYPTIGREYMQRNPHVIYARSQWMRYDSGVWLPFHDYKLEDQLWDLLEQYDPFPTDRGVSNIVKFVRGKRVREEDELDTDETLINLRNGTYSLEHHTLLTHDPSRLITTQLSFDYDPLAPYPNWQRYLETTFVDRNGQTDHELIAFMQEAIGYSLTTDIRHHVTFWCYGEGANGKGVLFYVLEQLAGSSAIPFNVDLLKREQYQLADLAGKRIALCPEADSGGVVEDAIIKALVAGDSLQVRQIRREPFTLHPIVKLWWSMNKLPTVTDTSVGMWRRIRLLPFLADFEGRDKYKRIDNLQEILIDELPGIFNWAMEGLARLRAHKEFTYVKQVDELTAKYRNESNTILTFVDDTCETDRSYNIGSQSIYSRYKEWCNENGYKPYNVRNFKAEMERCGFYYRRTSTARIYDGLRFKGQGNAI